MRSDRAVAVIAPNYPTPEKVAKLKKELEKLHAQEILSDNSLDN